MHLRRKLAAELRRHYSLYILHDVRNQASVIVELFGAVCNFDAGLLADELIVRALVDVLKTPPAADVKDQNIIKLCRPGLNVLTPLPQSHSVFDLQAALAFVAIG